MSGLQRVNIEIRCAECGSGSVVMKRDFSGEACRWCGSDFDRAKARREAFAAAGLKPLTPGQMMAKVEEILERGDEA